MKKVLASALITIIYTAFISTLWNTVCADKSYIESRKLLKKEKYDSALSQANKSIRKNPNEPRYYYGRAKILIASAVESKENRTQKSLALNDLRKSIELNPKNLVTIRNIVPIYYFLAINNVDEDFINSTKNYYNKIKHYSKNDVGVYTLLAKYEKRLGLTDGHKKSLENIKRLRPDLLDWHPSLR